MLLPCQNSTSKPNTLSEINGKLCLEHTFDQLMVYNGISMGNTNDNNNGAWELSTPTLWTYVSNLPSNIVAFGRAWDEVTVVTDNTVSYTNNEGSSWSNYTNLPVSSGIIDLAIVSYSGGDGTGTVIKTSGGSYYAATSYSSWISLPISSALAMKGGSYLYYITDTYLYYSNKTSWSEGSMTSYQLTSGSLPISNTTMIDAGGKTPSAIISNGSAVYTYYSSAWHLLSIPCPSVIGVFVFKRWVNGVGVISNSGVIYYTYDLVNWNILRNIKENN